VNKQNSITVGIGKKDWDLWNWLEKKAAKQYRHRTATAIKEELKKVMISEIM